MADTETLETVLARIAAVRGPAGPLLPGEAIKPSPGFTSLGGSYVYAPRPVRPKADELVFAASVLLLGERVPDGQLVEAVMIPWEALAEELKRDPSLLQQLDSRRFEELVAAAYTKMGFEVTLTPRSGDRGRDVIAESRGLLRVRVLDQVKRYAAGNLVPADDVRAMYGVLGADSRASKAYVTTSSDFAPGVADEFKAMTPTRLELRNGRSVCEWFAGLVRRS
jgi:restriction system protein